MNASHITNQIVQTTSLLSDSLNNFAQDQSVSHFLDFNSGFSYHFFQQIPPLRDQIAQLVNDPFEIGNRQSFQQMEGFCKRLIRPLPDERPLSELRSDLQSINNLAQALIPSYAAPTSVETSSSSSSSSFPQFFHDQIPVPLRPLSLPLPIPASPVPLTDLLVPPHEEEAPTTSGLSYLDLESDEESDLVESQAEDPTLLLIFKDFKRLQMAHCVMADLYDPKYAEIKKPWIDALSCSAPEVYIAFPTLIEGYLMLEDSGYPHRDIPSELRIKYAEIRAQDDPHLYLIKECAKELKREDLSQGILFLKSEAISSNNRLLNEKFSELAARYREKIAELEKIDPRKPVSVKELEKQIEIAMKAESSAFLQKVIEGPSCYQIPPGLRDRLMIWLAERDQLSLLKSLLGNNHLRLSKESVLQAMKKADRFEHSQVFDFLFSQYRLENGNELSSLLTLLSELGKTNFLAPLFQTNRSAISLQMIGEAMKKADANDRTEAFDFLFSQYPLPSPQAKKQLLLFFAENGLTLGLAKLLIKSSGPEINEAFKKTVEWTKGCLGPYLKPEIFPQLSKESLNEAFTTLSSEWNFVDLWLFNRADVIEHLSEKAKDALNDFFEHLCVAGIDPDDDVCSFFSERLIASLIKIDRDHTLLNSLSEKDIFDWFVNSPLFDQLPLAEWEEFLMNEALLGNQELITAFLDSRRGGEIPQTTFEKILVKCPSESSLLALIHKYPSYSGETLVTILLEAETASGDLIKAIFSKEKPEDPIPLGDLSSAFKQIAAYGNLDSIQAFYNHNPQPDLSDEEIQALSNTLSENKREEAVALLMQLTQKEPAAKRLKRDSS